jgi:membrane associated rhomboid family serine protease
VRAARTPQTVPRSVFGAPLAQGKPWLTIGVIIACVAVYALQMAAGDRLTDRLSMVPALAAAEPWRLITNAFLHGSVIHLALNMYALWVVGSFLETLLGRWRFAALYFLSALGGSACVLAVADLLSGSAVTADELGRWLGGTVGASGAVFGLFGAIVWVTRRLRADARGILVVIGINVVYSFTAPSISWQGHMGGLAVGLALGAAFAFAPPRRQAKVGVAATVAAAVVLAVVIAVAAQGIPEGMAELARAVLEPGAGG